MAQTEGRIELALQAYRAGKFSSLRAAARAFDIPQTTLARRNQGTPSRADFTSLHRKLTQTKEYTLVQWILSIDTRGIPPTQALVQQMAELLRIERVRSKKAKLGQC